jgi:hypothetical protein
MSFDGKSPPGIVPGVPGEATSTLRLNEPAVRSLVVELNQESIAVRTWPAQENHQVRAEFHY